MKDLVSSPGDSDMDLWPRIQQAIDATVVSRADAEWQWPTCHRKNCHQDHGDIDFVFRMFAKAVADSIHGELLCKAVSEPDNPGQVV